VKMRHVAAVDSCKGACTCAFNKQRLEPDGLMSSRHEEAPGVLGEIEV
jgi:hypothetical protein